MVVMPFSPHIKTIKRMLISQICLISRLKLTTAVLNFSAKGNIKLLRICCSLLTYCKYAFYNFIKFPTRLFDSASKLCWQQPLSGYLRWKSQTEAEKKLPRSNGTFTWIETGWLCGRRWFTGLLTSLPDEPIHALAVRSSAAVQFANSVVLTVVFEANVARTLVRL